jgi:hypothetical protein
MIWFLIKYIRRKVKESQSIKFGLMPDDVHLVPAVAPGQDGSATPYKIQHGHGQTSPAEGHVDPIGDEEAARQKAEASQRTLRQWKLMLGLALPNFLAAVDVTIVAPAIPLISSHFGMISQSHQCSLTITDMNQATWVGVSTGL